ncbi:MAG: transporter, permease protein [Gammaproteobacteria bacterium]|nr:transporter, permease protein [Gammaproteobacteria bacterium]
MNFSLLRLPALAFCSILLLWEGVVVFFEVPDYLVPSPVQIAALIPSRFGDLFSAFIITGAEALGGFILSAVVGIAVGLFFSVSAIIRRCFYPYVVLLQTIPIIAISPLILLWLGNGSSSVLFISFLISLPAVIVNTTQGLISVEPNLLNLFKMGNAGIPTILFKLRLPHAMPHVFVGLKIAAGASVVGALVGETFAGSSALGAGGLGYSSIYALSQLATPYLFALILASSLLGLLFFFAVAILERLTVGRWHESILGDRME